MKKRQEGQVREMNTVSETPAEKNLSTGLGLFSLGLGLAELAAPKLLSRAIGINEPKPTLMRAFGMREIAAGVGLLAQPRPAVAMWSRVGGDLLDLGTLLIALRNDDNDRDRTAAATAAVAGVLIVDLVSAILLSRARQKGAAGTSAENVSPSFIVNKSLGECFSFFQTRLDDFLSAPKAQEGSPAEIVSVSFNESVTFTLGDREVTVRFVPAIRGATRVVIDSPKSDAREALRRFKALIETGEIPTTQGQSEGPRSLLGTAMRGLEQ